MMLRVAKPAPQSRITDRASSTTTRVRRVFAPRRPPARVPPSASAKCGSPRAACTAGTTPKSSATATEVANANASAGKSSAACSIRGTSGGAAATTNATSTRARSTPNTPPASASTPLSMNAWRTMRMRLAPNARRTASSRWRAVARASCRFAAFTQPISSRNPTAPSSIQRTRGVVGPSSDSMIGVGTVVTSLRIVGSSAATRAASDAMTVRVCSSDAADLSRAMPPNTKLSRRRRSGSCSVVIRSGTQTSASRGQRAPGGSTPTTGRLIPLISTVAPTMSAREPNWLRQNRSEMTMARGAFGIEVDRLKHTTFGRRRAERVEELRRHRGDGHAYRLARAGQVHVDALERRDGVEHMVVAPVDEVRVRDRPRVTAQSTASTPGSQCDRDGRERAAPATRYAPH